MEFRWNNWNIEHVESHGVRPREAEAVISAARRPFPLKYPNDKWMVWAPGNGGRILQVFYLLDNDGTIYVIHARPLNEREKRRYRKRRGQ
jgi:uncharacterized DUF497 family protein